MQACNELDPINLLQMVQAAKGRGPQSYSSGASWHLSSISTWQTFRCWQQQSHIWCSDRQDFLLCMLYVWCVSVLL